MGLTRGVTWGISPAPLLRLSSRSRPWISWTAEEGLGLPLSTPGGRWGQPEQHALMQCQPTCARRVPLSNAPAITETTKPRGAAYLARLAVGFWDSARERCPPCGSWIAVSSPPWTRSAAPSCSTTGIAP